MLVEKYAIKYRHQRQQASKQQRPEAAIEKIITAAPAARVGESVGCSDDPPGSSAFAQSCMFGFSKILMRPRVES